MTVKGRDDGKLTVASAFQSEKQDGQSAPPEGMITLTGTPEQLDDGFMAFAGPACSLANGSKTAAASNVEFAKAAIRKLDGKPRRAQLADALVQEARKAADEGRYNLAEALLSKAAELTDDKAKKELVLKDLASASENKMGFLCEDEPEEAEKAFEATLAALGGE